MSSGGPKVLMPDGALKRQGDSLAPQGVVCKAYLSTNTTASAGSGWKVIPLDTKDFDPYNFYSTSTYKFTPTLAGYYRLTATVNHNISSGTVYLAMRKNAGSYEDIDIKTGAANTNVTGSTIMYFNGTTDYVEPNMYWGTSNWTWLSASGRDPFTYFTAQLLGTSVGVIPEPWHVVGATGEPAFGSGFSNYGSGYSTAAFFKDPHNIVHLKGTTTNASSTANAAAIFTLPAGYRPAEIPSFAAQANNLFGEVRVSTAGAITLSVGNTTFLSLDGMTFRAEQ